MGATDLPIFQWPSSHILLVSFLRLGLAALLGAVIGLQRERVHSTAGGRARISVCTKSLLKAGCSVSAASGASTTSA